MSVRVLFECDGCSTKAEGVRRMRKEFVSVSGRNYGIGTARWLDRPEDLAPEGWIAADPYTYCCYCPNCWAEIQQPPTATQQELDCAAGWCWT